MGDEKTTVRMLDDAMPPMHATELRQVVQEAVRPLAERVEHVEKKVEKNATDIAALGVEVAGFASALTACANAAASAANAALDAKATANTLKDETAKMIAGALNIHQNAIAGAVDEAIKKAVGTLPKDVEALQKSDEAKGSAMVVVARALGVEKQLDKQLVASVPVTPGASSGTLKHSRVVQAVIAVGLLAKVLLDLLAPHH